MPEINHRGKISFRCLVVEEEFLRKLKTILRLGCCCFSSVADVEALAESPLTGPDVLVLHFLCDGKS